MTTDLKKNVQILSDIENVNMEDQWFEIENEKHFWFEWRFKFLLKLLKKNNINLDEHLHVLDIGSGSGALSRQIEKHSNWTIDCVDMNQSILEKNFRKRGSNYIYNIHDKNNMFQEKYNLVIIFDVIEHIENVPKFLESAKFHLKKNGLILINVPSIPSLYSVYDQQMGHFRRYNKKKLISEFKDLDINIIDLKFWGFSLIPFLFMRKIILIFLKIKEKNIIEFGFKEKNIFFKVFMKIIMRIDIIIYNHKIGTSLMLLGENN